MMKVITIVLSFTLSYCCTFGQQKGLMPYPNDKTIADEQGCPQTATTYYFPTFMFQDTTVIIDISDTRKPKEDRADERNVPLIFRKYNVGPGCETTKASISKDLGIPIDSLTEIHYIKTNNYELEWFSDELRFAKEPILYNSYLGKDIYRFTWLRSFERPVIITLEKDGNEVRLTTKTLTDSKVDSINNHTALPTFEGNSELLIDSAALAAKEFNHFTKLLGKGGLLRSPHTLRRGCIVVTDGAMWIFEAHTKEGYYCTSRHAPKEKEPINTVGKFLIKLSKPLKNDEIY